MSAFEAPGARSSFALIPAWSAPVEAIMQDLLEAYATHFRYDEIAVGVLLEDVLLRARAAADAWLAARLCVDCGQAFRMDDFSSRCDDCDAARHAGCTDDAPCVHRAEWMGRP